MPVLSFHKPQTSDCIGFPKLLAFGAGKQYVHIGQNSHRITQGRNAPGSRGRGRGP